MKFKKTKLYDNLNRHRKSVQHNPAHFHRKLFKILGMNAKEFLNVVKDIYE